MSPPHPSLAHHPRIAGVFVTGSLTQLEVVPLAPGWYSTVESERLLEVGEVMFYGGQSTECDGCGCNLYPECASSVTLVDTSDSCS